MEVTEDETATSCRHIPPHDFNIQMNISRQLSSRIVPKIKLRCLLRKVGLPYRILEQLSGHQFYMEVSQAIHHHYYLYIRLSRPVPVYDQERMEEPWLELNENQFYQMFGYYKSQFIEIMNNLVLLPDKVQGHNSCAKAPMPIGICMMLR